MFKRFCVDYSNEYTERMVVQNNRSCYGHLHTKQFNVCGAKTIHNKKTSFRAEFALKLVFLLVNDVNESILINFNRLMAGHKIHP